ncbi:hypothetical protein AAEP93_008660 [Penicillium crustosum]
MNGRVPEPLVARIAKRSPILTVQSLVPGEFVTRFLPSQENERLKRTLCGLYEQDTLIFPSLESNAKRATVLSARAPLSQYDRILSMFSTMTTGDIDDESLADIVYLGFFLPIDPVHQIMR